MARSQHRRRKSDEEILREAAPRLAAEGIRGVASSEASLASLLPTLPGRSIVAVRYGVMSVNEEPSPEDFDTWVHDFGKAHLLDFGLEFTLDDGRTLHATWIGPPCYYLGLAARPLERGSSGHDVATMAPWPALLRRSITHVTITRDLRAADTFGIADESVAVPLDAEFHLEGGNSFFLSARRYDPDLGDERAEPYSDTILVTFGRDAARTLGVGPFASTEEDS